jgi:hypothetical protein
MKAILRHRDHSTTASRFAIATENIDGAWLTHLGKVLGELTPPPGYEREFKPELLLLPGPYCAPDERLLELLGDTGSIKPVVSNERWNHAEELMNVDVLFSPDNVTLQESLALGTVRVVLPTAGGEGEDPMMDHLIRREASPRLPDPDAAGFRETMQEMLRRVCFDPAYRRGQNRIGQYLCDGIGSIRIVRSTAFKVYAVPQNLVRYFDLGDPIISEL